MLNRDVCKLCREVHQAGWALSDRLGWLGHEHDQNHTYRIRDSKSYEEGRLHPHVHCPGDIVDFGTTRVDGEASDWCPYAEEHVVSEECR